VNPFLTPVRDLLSQWKLIRTDIKDKPEPDQLQIVVDFWSKAPVLSMAYDPEALDTYPAPWEMMTENNWCQNSVAVGMDFTLRLGGWNPNRLQIQMIRDYEASIQKLVVVVDGKYLLNYEYGCVTLLDGIKYDVLEKWSFTGRHYERAS
jgi:hypothetical protein